LAVLNPLRSPGGSTIVGVGLRSVIASIFAFLSALMMLAAWASHGFIVLGFCGGSAGCSTYKLQGCHLVP